MDLESLLTDSERELLPDEKAIAFYRDHGWYITPVIYSDEEIDRLAGAMDAFYAGHRDRHLPLMPRKIAYWRPQDGPDAFRIHDYIVYESHEVCRLLTKPLLGAIAARLAGSEVRVFNTSMMFKPPKGDGTQSVVGWHTDRAYWRTCTSDNMLTAWIPLHDTSVDNGTITMIDGSHTWRNRQEFDPSKALHFIRSDLDELEAQLVNDAEGIPIRKVPMRLKRGQVSFHHCLTYHGSPDNVSATPRKAFSVHIQDTGNRYREYRFSNSELAVYNSDELCRTDAAGRPDYTDPEFFPPFAPTES